MTSAVDKSAVSLSTLMLIALKDLRHEFLLSSCLVVALAGVVAPLLVLFGLKSGVIETLRSKLVNDPVFRELKPEETRIYSPEFFSSINEYNETAFAIGSVTKGASVIRLDNAAENTGQFLDMLPSGPGDPLLIEYGVSPPLSGEVVISHPVAAALQLKPGDVISLSSSRTDGTKRRQATASMTVTGVLPVQADAIERVYVPLQFAVDIEAFREGFEIAARGWDGSSLEAKPVFHGVAVALGKNLSSTEQQRAISNTGFFNVDILTEEEFVKRFLFSPPEHVALYDISVIDSPAQGSAVQRLSSRLSGYLIEYWPYVHPLSVQIKTANEQWQRFDVISSPTVSGGEVSLPENVMNHLDDVASVQLRINTVNDTLSFNATIGAVNSFDRILMSSMRMGILLQAQDKPMTYNETGDQFVSRPSGYRGFRLFAKSINDVEGLGNKLARLGVPTRSSVQEILRLKALDNGLNSLFAVIAVLGVVTGVIVFIASQYGAVQRKKAALAHLRLMGLARHHVAAIPMVQGVFLALLGAALGAILTYLISGVINHWFAKPLGFEGQVSVVQPITIVIATVSLLALSLIASSGAAISATAIDPADGMRNE